MKQSFKRTKTSTLAFQMILTALNTAGLQHRNSTNRERVWKKTSSCRKYALVALEEKRSLDSAFR